MQSAAAEMQNAITQYQIANAQMQAAAAQLQNVTARMRNTARDMRLIDAAGSGRVADVAALLADGANVDPPRTEQGSVTALIVACVNGHTEVVTQLLAANAKVDQVRPGTRPPWEISLPFERNAISRRFSRVGWWLAGYAIDVLINVGLMRLFWPWSAIYVVACFFWP